MHAATNKLTYNPCASPQQAKNNLIEDIRTNVCVKRAQGIIEQHYIGVIVERACDRNPLALSPTKRDTFLPDLREIAVR